MTDIPDPGEFWPRLVSGRDNFALFAHGLDELWASDLDATITRREMRDWAAALSAFMAPQNDALIWMVASLRHLSEQTDADD